MTSDKAVTLSGAAKSRYLLLVENEDDDVVLTQRACRRVDPNIAVVLANNGNEAMRLFMGNGLFARPNGGQNPFLILLDLGLPSTGGHVLLHFFRSERRTRGIPVVVVSASKSEEAKLESMNLGAAAFVEKPLTTDKLAKLLLRFGSGRDMRKAEAWSSY